MKVLFLLALVVLVVVNGLPVSVNQRKTYHGYKIYRLSLDTQQQLDYLVSMNDALQRNEMTEEVEFLTDTSLLSPDFKTPISVMVSPGQEAAFLKAMKAEAIRNEVALADLEKYLEEERYISPEDQRTVDNSGMTWTAYHRYETIERYVQTLAANYPDLVTLTTLGKSYEGRNLYLLKIGKPRADGAVKPAVWMDSQIHAREWIAAATVTYMVNKMVTGYATDATSRRMLDQIDWYVLPVINVDGYEYTHTNQRLWRKTRRVNPFSQYIGADPNRNYDHKWMVRGADQNPSSEIYAGAYPLSEFENVLVTDAVLQHKSQIKTLLTFHSAAEMWLLPWGYDSSVPDDFEDLRQMGLRATAALKALYGVSYRVGSSTQLLGAAAGATDDWGKSKGMIKYSATVELRDQGYGFTLPPSQIIASGEETFAAINVVAQIVYDEYGPTLPSN
ncbi:Carboxypeptidase B [Hypsibius exemplaris]|uniref:Carboxypeptidase B n=1 Tax=Hypsibius exemplaris TaxID=2072580 RepID=A0A9X6NCL9_HYPEX|nr:Carboxypeptidase B [Hypsibius exemplaris]